MSCSVRPRATGGQGTFDLQSGGSPTMASSGQRLRRGDTLGVDELAANDAESWKADVEYVRDIYADAAANDHHPTARPDTFGERAFDERHQ